MFRLIAALILMSMPIVSFAEEPSTQEVKKTPEGLTEQTLTTPPPGERDAESRDEAPEKIKPVKEIIVTSKRETQPSKTVIDVETAQPVGSPQNIMELLSGQSMLDYRGKTSLVPDDDTYYLRGFGAERFATSIDGMTIRKTGGRKSSHVVDYGLLPPWLIERVEILPGPHSALYPGKAIGGVINFITRTPHTFKTLKPDISLSAGYGSYNTQIYNAVVNGAVQSFIYDLGFQRYSTNGNMRQSDAAVNNFYGRIGGVFPRDGFLTASHAYSRADRAIPVNNNLAAMQGDPLALFNPDYPLVFNSEFNNWQNPTWDKIANTTRLNFCQPTPYGTIRATGYYSKENRDRRYPAYINRNNPPAGVYDASWETIFWQYGGRVEYEITYKDEHTTTAAFDFEKLEDGCGRAPSYSLMAYRKKERVGILAGALQHRWSISKLMDLTAGLRYEDVTILVSNFTTSGYKLYITGKPTWIRRHWAGVIPKSFVTFKFDKVAEWMRDTSVSVGVSRIWHAPDYHGMYNPQGRPAGAWLNNEDGAGYDFILMRRIWRDITFQARYYLYDIKEYIAHNSAFSLFSGKNAPAGLECMDYVTNLARVHRHGMELNLHGEIIDGLSFHTSYSYQEFRYKGKSYTDRLTAKVELDGQARHHFKAGLRYLLEYTNTAFMADYGYESEQAYMNPVEIATDTYVFYATRINPYHLLDIAIEQTILKDKYYFRNLKIKLYIKNILNDIYQDSQGYQMPGHTFGGEISMKF
ncbi:MAG: TonB-dependent receptor plug domain-containing protein [Spirochaetes bacterium]|nr:TonB-dependent receptor plug domain-containing protein [Spirochaetota bacterium]